MPDRKLRIRLSARDRDLILRYGYTFGPLRDRLLALAGDGSVRAVVIDLFRLEQLIGDLSYSTNHGTRGSVQLELNDLCERLEGEERRCRTAI
jgi:hypothetical protein